MGKGYGIRVIAKEDLEVRFREELTYFKRGETIPKGTKFIVAYWQKGDKIADMLLDRLGFEKNGSYDIQLDNEMIVTILKTLATEDDEKSERDFGRLLYVKMKMGRGQVDLEWIYE